MRGVFRDIDGVELSSDYSVLGVVRQSGDGRIVVYEDVCLFFWGWDLARVWLGDGFVGWWGGREVAVQGSYESPELICGCAVVHVLYYFLPQSVLMLFDFG